MKGSIGCPARTIPHIPHRRYLAYHLPEELSEKAKQRLKIIDFYHQKSAYFSSNGRLNVSLAYHHFGIHRSRFYRWYGLYNKKHLCTLENKSTSPHKKRQPEYSQALVEKVREPRKADPTYSGKKLHPILKPKYGKRTEYGDTGTIESEGRTLLMYPDGKRNRNAP